MYNFNSMTSIRLLLLISVVLASDFMHATHYKSESDEAIEHHIEMKETIDYEKYLDRLSKPELITCKKSPNGKNEYFQFFYKTSGHIGTHGHDETIQLHSFEDDCFDSMTVHYHYNTMLRRVIMTFQAGNPRQPGFCTEAFVVGTTLNYNYVTINNNKPHKIFFNNLSNKQLENFETAGAYIFRTCDDIGNYIGDVLLTAELFFGGLSAHPLWGPIFGSKPASWMINRNVDFLEKSMGHRPEERPNIFTDLFDSEVHSGDFLAVSRFDGLDQMIEWGTNGYAGHSCMLLELDGVMHVVESQDAWYWPKKHIQRNTWKDWKRYAQNAGFNVVHLPLSAESRAKWNQTAAEAFFRQSEGLPYGYHNFIFGWLDTPDANYPPPLTPEFALFIFSFIEKISSSAMTSFVGEALNFRLGTKNLSIDEIAVEAAKRNISPGELFAIVEQDDWVYSDGPSMACAAFVASLYKHAGLLGDVQGTEFTPKDIYQLDIYDHDYKVPAKCLKNDPDMPYCQLMGTHRMWLEGYNTVKPYDHMNEKCPSFRTEGC